MSRSGRPKRAAIVTLLADARLPTAGTTLQCAVEVSSSEASPLVGWDLVEPTIRHELGGGATREAQFRRLPSAFSHEEPERLTVDSSDGLEMRAPRSSTVIMRRPARRRLDEGWK